MAKKRGLAPQQRRFVDEFLVDLNASAAYTRAGYKAKPEAARTNAARLLSNAHVQAAIEVATAKRSARTGITQDRVLEELSLLSFSDLTHYIVDDTGNVKLSDAAPAGAMRALQSIKRRMTTRQVGKEYETVREVEIRLWDKPGPLKLAGQHVGLFVDRRELTGKNGAPLPPMVFTVKLSDQRGDD